MPEEVKDRINSNILGIDLNKNSAFRSLPNKDIGAPKELKSLSAFNPEKAQRINEQASLNAYDPFGNAKAEGVNLAPSQYGGLNFERYYNRNTYQKLGFSPYVDNEAILNENNGFWDDFLAAKTGALNLGGLSFNIFSLGPAMGMSEEEEAMQYERASNIYSSTDDGWWSRNVNNAVLNSGYTLGLLTGIAAEEIAMTAGTLATGGGAGPAATARTAQNINRLRKGFKSFDGVKRAQNIKSTYNYINDLKSIDNARKFKQFGAKALDAVNPLRGTTGVVKDLRKGVNPLSDFAKVSKTTGAFYRDVREIKLALDESGLEAGFISNNVRRELISQYQADNNGELPAGEDLELIEQQTLEAKDRTYNWNAGMIYATNRISFGNAFNKWMPRAFKESATKIQGLGQVVRDSKAKKLSFLNTSGAKGIYNKARHYITKTSAKDKLILGTKGAAKYLRANFGEGIQEYLQETVQAGEEEFAKRKYSSTVAGGVLANVAIDDGYFHSMKEGFGSLMNEEGFEVFMGGFMMGGVAGPYMNLMTATTSGLTKGGNFVFNRKEYKEQQEYKKTQEKAIKESIESFNNMTDPQKDFIKNYTNHIINQAEYKQEMDDASEKGDRETFQNIKDVVLGEKVSFAIEMGAFDLFIDKLQDLSEMNEEEFNQAFGEQISNDPNFYANFKESNEKIIERSRRIKQFADNFNEMFPEPDFSVASENEEVYEGMTAKEYKNAWSVAKNVAVMNQHMLSRTLERQQDLRTQMSEKSPFSKPDESIGYHIENILFKRDLSNHLTLLKTEISNLEDFADKTDTQKRDLKFKKETLESLEKLNQNYNLFDTLSKKVKESKKEIKVGDTLNFQSRKNRWKGKVTEVTDNNYIVDLGEGKTKKVKKDDTNVIEIALKNASEEEIFKDVIDSIKEPLKEYIKTIGKNEGNTLLDQNFDEFFELFMDFKSLDEESNNLSEAINTLMNPENLEQFIIRYNSEVAKSNEDFREEMAEHIKMFLNANATQKLMNMLAKEYNAFLTEADLVAIEENYEFPSAIYDISTGALIQPSSERYANIKKAIDTYIKEISPAEEVKEEVEDTTPKEETDVEETAEDLTSPSPQTTVGERIEPGSNLEDITGKAREWMLSRLEEERADLNALSPEDTFDSVEDMVDNIPPMLPTLIKEYNDSIEVSDASSTTLESQQEVPEEVTEETSETIDLDQQETVINTVDVDPEFSDARYNSIDNTLEDAAQAMFPITISERVKLVNKVNPSTPNAEFVFEHINQARNKKYTFKVDTKRPINIKTPSNLRAQARSFNLPTSPTELYQESITIGEDTYYGTPDIKQWFTSIKNPSMAIVTVTSENLVRYTPSQKKKRQFNIITKELSAQTNLLDLQKKFNELNEQLADISLESGYQGMMPNELIEIKEAVKQEVIDSMDFSDFRIGDQYTTDFFGVITIESIDIGNNLINFTYGNEGLTEQSSLEDMKKSIKDMRSLGDPVQESSSNITEDTKKLVEESNSTIDNLSVAEANEIVTDTTGGMEELDQDFVNDLNQCE